MKKTRRNETKHSPTWMPRMKAGVASVFRLSRWGTRQPWKPVGGA